MVMRILAQRDQPNMLGLMRERNNVPMAAGLL